MTVPRLRPAFTTATLGGDFPAKVRAISGAGFESTEIWAKDLFEHLEGPEVALRVLADTGLAISALQAIRNVEGCEPTARPRKMDLVRQMLDLACIAGSPLVTLAANVEAGAVGDHGQLVNDLGMIADEARARNLRIAYEPIAWAPHVYHWRQGLALVEAVDSPALGLQLDVFHAFMRGDARIALDEIPPARLFLIEVSDFAASNLDPLEISRHYRLFPGEGRAPLAPFAADLRASGYIGDVVVEVFNTALKSLPPDAVARRGRERYRDLFEHTAQPDSERRANDTRESSSGS